MKTAKKRNCEQTGKEPMRVRIKLMGVLKEQAPLGNELELPDGATIEDALRALDVSLELVAIFTVNGQLERDAQRPLDEGDELSVLPPVAGG